MISFRIRAPRSLRSGKLGILRFKAVAEDINTGTDNAKIQEWRDHLLTTPANFTLVDTEAGMEWRAAQLRENMSQEHASLSRTPVQRIFELAHKRAQLGGDKRCTPERMCELYKQNLQLSSMSEPMTRSFCDMAFTIWDRALSKGEVREAVMEQEDLCSAAFRAWCGVYQSLYASTLEHSNI